MRKIILFIACSLDGYIAREDGDTSWLFMDQDYNYSKFYSSVDTIIMGRVTYEQALTFSEFPFKGKECFVFSRRDNLIDDGRVKWINDNNKDRIEELRNREGGNIWLVGGASLISYFQENGWIDEYIISFHPILLGKGIQLFYKMNDEQNLKLINSQSYNTGLVQLHYIKV